MSPKPSIEPKKKSRQREQRGSSAFPAQFFVSEEMRTWAREKHILSNLNHETAKFADYYRSTGVSRKDWVAAWRNWMRKADEFASSTSSNGSGRTTRSEREIALGDIRAYRDTGQHDEADKLQALVDSGAYDNEMPRAVHPEEKW